MEVEDQLRHRTHPKRTYSRVPAGSTQTTSVKLSADSAGSVSSAVSPTSDKDFFETLKNDFKKTLNQFVREISEAGTLSRPEAALSPTYSRHVFRLKLTKRVCTSGSVTEESPSRIELLYRSLRNASSQKIQETTPSPTDTAPPFQFLSPTPSPSCHSASSPEPESASLSESVVPQGQIDAESSVPEGFGLTESSFQEGSSQTKSSFPKDPGHSESSLDEVSSQTGSSLPIGSGLAECSSPEDSSQTEHPLSQGPSHSVPSTTSSQTASPPHERSQTPKGYFLYKTESSKYFVCQAGSSCDASDLPQAPCNILFLPESWCKILNQSESSNLVDNQADSSCEDEQNSSGDPSLAVSSFQCQNLTESCNVKEELNMSFVVQEEAVSSFDVKDEADSSSSVKNELESSSVGELSRAESSCSTCSYNPTKRPWSSLDPIPVELNPRVVLERIPESLLKSYTSTTDLISEDKTESDCEISAEVSRSSVNLAPLEFSPIVRLEKIPLPSLCKSTRSELEKRISIRRQIALEHDYVCTQSPPKRRRMMRFRRNPYSGRYPKKWS